MGTLTYDGLVVHFDDRVLSHVQIVVVAKLRRNESFLMSWRDSDAVGDGRSSIWLSDSIPLYFKFSGGHTPLINRDWIEQLSRSADSVRGLVIMSEHDALLQLPQNLRPGADSHNPKHTGRSVVVETIRVARTVLS